MNPLGLDPTRFVVAVDDARGGEIVGFGQLKPWETLSDRPKDDVVGQVVRRLGGLLGGDGPAGRGAFIVEYMSVGTYYFDHTSIWSSDARCGPIPRGPEGAPARRGRPRTPSCAQL